MYGIKLQWSDKGILLITSTTKFIEMINQHGIPHHLHLSYWLSPEKQQYDSLPHCVGHPYHYMQTNSGECKVIPSISIDDKTDNLSSVRFLVDSFKLNAQLILSQHAQQRLNIIGVI